MEENNKYMDNLDEFSLKIQEKLSSHRITPDEDTWQAIQNKMNKPKKSIPSWVYWSVLYWGMTAAAVVALILTIKVFYTDSESVSPEEDLIAVVDEPENEIDAPKESPLEEFFQESIAELPSVKQSSPSQSVSPSSKETQYANEDITVDDVLSTIPEIENLAVEIYEANSENLLDEFENLQYADNQVYNQVDDEESAELESNQTLEEINKSQLEHELLFAEATTEDWTDVYAQNHPKKKRISISGVLGSGVGGSSSSIKPRSYAYKDEKLMNIPTKYTNIATPRDFSNKDYMPPVAAGLNLRLPLNDRFSVESGMTYTVLRTRLSNGFSLADIMASIDLHYLGVPANLVYSFVKTNKWDVYISAGAMLEKGLQGDFKQLQNKDEQRIMVQANPYIDGVQWSINSSVGVGYYIHKHVAFFFDPKISYYLENDQPYSIRSELPFIFSLNSGVRFAF